MNRTKEMKSLTLHIFGLLLGIVGIILAESNVYHVFYVVAISLLLIMTVVADADHLVRPYSYLVLSFFVFVWMRYIINIYDGRDIISVGNGVTPYNTNIVSVWLGVSMNTICIFLIISSHIFFNRFISFFEGSSRIRFRRSTERIILFASLLFFVIFLIDSIKKISVVQMHDYLNVSETILTQGYWWFKIGKWLLLIWIIMGRDEDKYFKGSTILAVAGLGYLMRGARGYAIMYFFLWLLFYSYRKRIKLHSLVIFGLILIFLANFIMTYRMGWASASGALDTINTVLYQQGASVEPVFGAVVFRDAIRERFSLYELFTRNDFGIIVDRARGIKWTSGGFGSSFFAESYFMGIPLSIIFLALAGICAGFVESAYRISRIKMFKYNWVESDRANLSNSAEFANIILFMTIPNLVYFGRSSIKDFIIKTLLVFVILVVVKGHYYTVDLCEE